MANLKGIDISYWQGEIDFSKVKHEVDFIILREGYGTTIDKKFKEYVKGCKNNNIPIHGVYHFCYSITEEEVLKEAQACIKNLQSAGVEKDAIIFFDFEYDTVKKAKAKGVTLGKTQCTNFTVKFCDYVISKGYKAGVYYNLDYMQSMYDMKRINKYVQWLALYNNGSKPSYDCTYHQYGSNGKINGISGNVDVDICYATKSNTSNSTSENKNTSPKNIIEKAVKWMENMANDNSHGYDQIYRWGEKGDYDCSAAVIAAWEQAGVKVKTAGATYTGNMLSVFKKNGFVDVTSKVNLYTGDGLQRGDVLLNTVHHTAMYCGNGKEVEASINEKGTATGGKPGDQTGREFLIRSYRNYPWTNVLRYAGRGNPDIATSNKNYLSKGDSGTSVKTMQKMLIKLGYSCGSAGADGDFGSGTDKALRAFQKANGLTVDGLYGSVSKARLESLYNANSNLGKQTTSLSKNVKWNGTVVADDGLNVRTWAGTENKKCSFSPLVNGTVVGVCDSVKAKDGSTWYYIAFKGKYGFVHSDYIRK